jgi:hypothetical protein
MLRAALRARSMLSLIPQVAGARQGNLTAPLQLIDQAIAFITPRSSLHFLRSVTIQQICALAIFSSLAAPWNFFLPPFPGQARPPRLHENRDGPFCIAASHC